MIPKKAEDAAIYFTETFQSLKNEIGKVVVGQDDVVDHLLLSLFSRGHCLLEGVPGLAKTLLISTLAKTMSLKFSRIQFTPDLMPGDITGMEIIEEAEDHTHKTFKFVKGPIFANIVLADEINRTPPKTQSALLEAMQEANVTSAGKTYSLDKPFFVLATQNPIEQEGTYPLPEAQLDRFMFNLKLDYPSFEQEVEIVNRTTSNIDSSVEAKISLEDIIALQRFVRDVPVPQNVIEFAVKLVSATRPNTEEAPEFSKQYLSWGAGPRASQYLIVGGKARALSQGRTHVSKEDIIALAKPILRHRIINNYTAEAEGKSVDLIIDELVTIIN